MPASARDLEIVSEVYALAAGRGLGLLSWSARGNATYLRHDEEALTR